jgi:hypothetical protein
MLSTMRAWFQASTPKSTSAPGSPAAPDTAPVSDARLANFLAAIPASSSAEACGWTLRT